MKYRLIYTERAIKDIRKIEPNISERIGKALLRYVGDPLKHGEKLTDPKIGQFRFRIGDYRVIFDLKVGDIVVLRVGHRKDIYRRL